jgi:ribonuclease-3
MAHQKSEPKWKRALDDVESFSTKAKKQKSNTSAEKALLDLEKGLTFVEFSPDASEEAKNHAKELRKLVLSSMLPSDPTVTTSKLLDVESRLEQIKQQAKSDHTDVPPPFPIKPGSVSISTGQPNGSAPPATIALPTGVHNKLPPLPPITELTLLSAPFTHTSALPYYMPATSTNSYEPLEFLGDAYLELMATRLIHERFSSHTVGQKAQLRETLIRNDNRSTYARAYGFEDRIKIGGTDLKQDTKSKAWVKILADVFEAYVACVVLSDSVNGYNICEQWLWQLWEPKVQDWRLNGSGKVTGDEEHASTDIKAMLQKYIATKGVRLEYLEEKPMEHVKEGNKTTFFMGVYLTGWAYTKYPLGSGSGRSKVIAGAEAAKDAFTRSAQIVEECHRRKVEYERLHHSNTHNSFKG